MPHIFRSRWLLATSLLSLAVPTLAQTCSARSGAQAATVVELYTSEGCNSCPPADRWLSSLPQDGRVIALSFHVDYWDHLGWVDRYASPANTQRQTRQQSVNGSRYNYTPQVVVNGSDRKDWRSMRLAPGANASVEVSLVRQPEAVEAQVRAGSNKRLAAYWAMTEMGHQSAVRAGENAGVTLTHDHVVREWREVPAWQATAGVSTTLKLPLVAPANAGRARRINLVVTDADTGRPVQALSLGC